MPDTTATTDQVTATAPPQGLRDFYFGAGAGVPGLYNLLNQATSNYFSTMGTPGATPYTYQGERIAGFTPAQQEAFRMGTAGVGSYLPFYQQAEDLYGQAGQAATGAYGTAAGMFEQGLGASMPALGQAYGALGGTDAQTGAIGYTQQAAEMLDPSKISDYMDPYVQDVVDPAILALREQTEAQKQAIAGRAVSAGAFGGRRADLLSADVERAGQRAMGETAGRLYSEGYGKAQAAQLAASKGLQGIGGQMGNIAGAYGSLGGLGADIYGQYGKNLGTMGMNLGTALGNLGGAYGGLGTSLYGLGGQDVNRMMNIGTMQQQQQQRMDDLAYQNFVGQYALPYQTLGQAFNIGTGAAPYMGSVGTQQGYQQTSSGQNPLLDWMGAGLGAYGVYKDVTSD